MRIKVTFPPHDSDTHGAGGGFRGGVAFLQLITRMKRINKSFKP